MAGSRKGKVGPVVEDEMDFDEEDEEIDESQEYDEEEGDDNEEEEEEDQDTVVYTGEDEDDTESEAQPHRIALEAPEYEFDLYNMTAFNYNPVQLTATANFDDELFELVSAGTQKLVARYSNDHIYKSHIKF